MKKKLRSPIWYFGGKGHLASWILDYFPEHREYIEPFFGGGSLFFGKTPAKVETINDINSDVMNFFKILRERPIEFIYLANMTPYSRELYNECWKTWKEEKDPLQKALKWWVVARMSFSGSHSWGNIINASSRGMAGTCSKFLSSIEHLPNVVQRLREIQIENAPATRVIERYATPTSLIYCDPPYLPKTRSSGKYQYEMTQEDHVELLNLLITIPGSIVLSSYPNEIYDEILFSNGWKRVNKKTSCYAHGRTREKGGLQGKGSATKHASRIECLWLNRICIDSLLSINEVEVNSYLTTYSGI